MESITNPTLVVTDIPAIVNEAKKLNILTIVDSTFATPLRQRPLDFGADIVLQSVTKFLGGYSDLLLGAVICKSNAHAEFMVKHRHDFGAIPGGLDAFLALRGLRTLAVRLDRSETNALELAKRLSEHLKIKKVYFQPCQVIHSMRRLQESFRTVVAGCFPSKLILRLRERTKFFNRLKSLVTQQVWGE